MLFYFCFRYEFLEFLGHCRARRNDVTFGVDSVHIRLCTLLFGAGNIGSGSLITGFVVSPVIVTASVQATEVSSVCHVKNFSLTFDILLGF